MISPTKTVIICPGASSLLSYNYNIQKCSGLKHTLEQNGYEVEFKPDEALAPTSIGIHKVEEVKSRSTGGEMPACSISILPLMHGPLLS